MYKLLSDELKQSNFDKANKIKAEIEKREYDLSKERFSNKYDKKKERVISYAEYVVDNNTQCEQLIFDISELSGNGNYKAVRDWTYKEIIDYTKRKTAQINLQKSKIKK